MHTDGFNVSWCTARALKSLDRFCRFWMSDAGNIGSNPAWVIDVFVILTDIACCSCLLSAVPTETLKGF